MLKKMDLQKTIIDICYNDKLTRREILAAYNQKYNQTMQEAAFNRSLNRGVMKFNQLQNVLDSIGYKR